MAIEIREIVISDPVRAPARPAPCAFCDGGPIDMTGDDQICRDCGEVNGTGTHYVNRGFLFIIRR